MAITPDTNIKLLKVPIEISNKNQITFANATAQFNYFNSLPKLEIERANYQRKDNVLDWPAHIDSIIEYNYCMYQNENYSNKWFYAFIVNMQYENNGCTKITLATDVFQTWQFDLEWKQSFIEREMLSVSDDVPGANLIPEGLELGEMKINATATLEELKPVYVVVYTGDVIKSVDGSTFKVVNQNGYEYNGIFSGVTFIIADEYGFSTLKTFLNYQDNSDHVLTIFTIPELAVKSLLPDDPPGTHTFYWEVLDRNFKEAATLKTLNSRPSSIDNYTPRNKKLLTYPYLYLGFNPQNGTSKIYRYEDFINATPSFKIISEISPNPEVQFIPQNYRGDSGDSLNDNGSLSGYPTISFKTDVFNTWLAQNSEIINLQMQQEQYNYGMDAIMGGVGMIGDLVGMASGKGGIGSASSYVNTASDLLKLDVNHEYYIKNQMAQIEKQKMLPDKATLSSSNSTLIGYDLMKYNIFTRYSIKSQFAERLDKYFDMYGYLTNTVKVPNLNNRNNWNYVKTIGANIIANIPQEDLQAIKELFNNGITLWHNPSTFLDYSQNNRN